MGRGKVELKRIEDKSSRQVTFSKRRSGLMKKARELSVLCDVEVALFIFSSRGRLYDFASGDSLRKILERYQTQRNVAEVNGARKLVAENRGTCTGANQFQIVQRILEGEKIENLSITELSRVENQLHYLLRQTRLQKTKLLTNAMTSLHEKEKQLGEENQLLEKEVTAWISETESHSVPPLQPAHPPPAQLLPAPGPSFGLGINADDG